MSITFTNLTGHSEIGANSYLLELDGKRIVLDSGMHPKYDGWAALPQFELLDPSPVDAVFLTHAHHDHCGSLPILMQRQPDAKVFMSEPTYHLADVLLHNSVNVMKRQRYEASVSEYPLYTHRDVQEVTRRWQACHLGEPWSFQGYPIKKHPESTTFTLHHAGHILGSVAVEIDHEGRKFLYTGDINLRNQTLMNEATLPTSGIDTLIIETTRGANPDPDGYSRDAVVDNLLNAINETFEAGGAVMIPVFAMGKTQEVLAILHYAMQKGRIPKSPLYIGGLSRSFSNIYDRMATSTRRRYPDLQLLPDIGPEVVDGRRISKLVPRRGHIYLISSGMMTEKTLSNILGQRMLAREHDSILFVGYCDPESPAGKLRSTQRDGRVTLAREEGDQPVKCRVEYFDLTSHAVRDDLLEYILRLNPRHTFLVHGDPDATEWFRSELAAKAPGMDVRIPEPGVAIPL